MLWNKEDYPSAMEKELHMGGFFLVNVTIRVEGNGNIIGVFLLSMMNTIIIGGSFKQA